MSSRVLKENADGGLASRAAVKKPNGCKLRSLFRNSRTLPMARTMFNWKSLSLFSLDVEDASEGSSSRAAYILVGSRIGCATWNSRKLSSGLVSVPAY